jgi:hypothetical protein
VKVNHSFLLVGTVLLSFSCSQVENFRSNGGFQSNRGYDYSNSQSSNSSPAKKEYKSVFRKSNLEALSIGRNRNEIQILMGEPEGKSLDGGNGYLWDYRRPVFDEATGEVFGWSLISFKFLKGLCAYVNIRLENLPPELKAN